MYIYGKRAHLKGDSRHNSIVDSVSEMERLRNPVLLGFIIFGTLWFAAVAFSIWYYFF